MAWTWKGGIWRQVAGLVFVVLMLGTGNVAAQDGAVAFLNGLRNDVATQVAAAELPDAQRQRNFRAILQRVFSLDEVCQQVLGRYGRSATQPERQEFRQLFEDILVVTWARRFRDYAGNGLHFGDAAPAANGDVMVASEVEGANHQLVAVECRLREEAGNYRLVDIKVEGASMLLTYQSEYQSVLRTGGMAALNGLLRKKVGDLGVSG